jgi:hypothetical protein
MPSIVWYCSETASKSFMAGRILAVRVLVLVLILATFLALIFMAPHLTLGTGVGGLVLKRVFGG